MASVVSFSLSVPPLAGAPAGRKDPLPRLEWLLLGPLSRWQGREEWMDGWREEGVTQTWRTLSTAPNLPHHPPHHPALLSSVPTYPPPHTDRLSSCCMCVYMCVCTCHLSPYGLLWWMDVSEKKGHVCVFVVVSERFLVCTACVCVCVSE